MGTEEGRAIVKKMAERLKGGVLSYYSRLLVNRSHKRGAWVGGPIGGF